MEQAESKESPTCLGAVKPFYFSRSRKLGAGETSSISQGLGNGAGIDIFKLTSDRNTPGKTAYFQPLSLKHHAELMRGRFTFGREVGSQNDLAHQTIVNATQQALDMQVIWTDAIKR